MRDPQEARQTIEALRLGGLPPGTDFTCGRETELRKILEAEGCLLLTGEHGVGRSHLLSAVRREALRKGFAVAYLSTDPAETPFYRPRNLYRAFTGSFTYLRNGSGKDFQDFVSELAEGSHSDELLSHPFIGELLRFWGMRDDSSWLVRWISGERKEARFLPSLYGSQYSANIYANIISGLGAAAIGLGLQGLLLIIDRAESLDSRWYTPYQYSGVENTLRVLRAVADNDPRAGEEITHNGLYTGKETGLLYCGQGSERYPFMWGDEAHTRIIFSSSSWLPVFGEMPEIHIRTLDGRELLRLWKWITEIYESAYGFRPENDIFRHLPQENTRLFVKASVETLDIMRWHPEEGEEVFGRIWMR